MATKFKRHRFPKDDGFDWRHAFKAVAWMAIIVIALLFALNCLFSMR